ncbi:MAG TPA: class II fructose-bisphosphate aldolase [Candidatus Paceibacterota bacterium]|nr:class II fructose-bisphosphate aldolase [Candidatus Paceibacterota bacterium]
MINLRQAIDEARQKNIAIGHFNVSDLAGLKAVVEGAKNLNVPVIVGVSEGERDFIGVRQIALLVKSFKDDYQIPVFLNADHTHSFEKIKEAVEAGFDAVLFDAGRKSLEENISETKKVVNFVKEYNLTNGTDIMVEGELGYIGSGSVLLDAIPQGVSVKKEDLTNPSDARKFIQETGIDLLAPAVGNIHGMLSNISDPVLDIDLIRHISALAGVPLVLHGASGNTTDDVKNAIAAGMSIVHINTELRVAWKRGLDLSLLSHPKEIVPYKILPEVVYEISKVVTDKLKIFNNL